MRVEPPPSLAVAMGTSPAATAAALPPEDPPGVRAGSHGLRVMPHAFVLVKLRVPNSGAAVLPIGTAPAARSRATWIESAEAGALALVEQRPVAGGHALAVVEVLHPEGDAGKGAGVIATGHGGVDGLRRRPGQVLVEVHERVEGLVPGGHLGQAGLQHLHGRALPCSHRLGDLYGGLLHGDAT